MTSMDNTPDSPAKTPEGYTTQGGNFWTLITPEIWKVLHAVLHFCTRIERDDALIAEIETEVSAFLAELEAEIEYLKRKAA